MGAHTSPVRGHVEDDEHPTHGFCSHVKPIEQDLPSEPTLDVETADRVVDGRQLGLDLDDDTDRAGRLKRKDVDRSTLAELGERDLDLDQPAEADQLVCCLTDKQRVALVQQTIDLAAPPRNHRVKARVDGCECRAERANRERGEVTALDQRNGLLREPGRGGEIGLAQVFATAERS